ncbi:MAG: SurA N-terminal domain-containing protein [Pseudomonadota bacterium]
MDRSLDFRVAVGGMFGGPPDEQAVAHSMLNALRKQAGSWVVKALLLLLVLSFAVWGIGDVFFGGMQNPAVATVGDAEVTSNELSQSFNQSLRSLQQRFGPQFDREQAVQLGIMQQALQELIAQRLLDLRGREMDLTVADATLRELITTDPVFQIAGRFDRSRFDQLLMANGLTEEGYLASLRQDVVRGSLTDSVTGPATVPDALVDALYRHRNESRSGRYVLVETTSIEDVPEPTEEDLQTYHDANQNRFTAPEYRGVTFITLEPDDLIYEIAISEDQIAAEYQDRIDSYRTPERRSVKQLLANDRETIEAAIRRLEEGESFADAAEALNDQGISLDDLGNITRNDLPTSVAAAVFEQPEAEIGSPVESPFGWHLFEITEIEPEQVVPLAEVRDGLAEELALTEARDRLPAFANQLDDELAAGVSLDEAAATLGLEAHKLEAVDREGRGQDSQPIEDLPPWPEFLETVAATFVGETSLLEETDLGAFFVVTVDSVAAPRLKPVDEVRDALAAAWQAEQRRDLARARAEELLARTDEVTSLDQLGEELPTNEIEPVIRSDRGTSQGITAGIVQALFSDEPGAIAPNVVETPAGFAIVAIDEVIDADPSEDADAIEQLRSELDLEARNDLLSQLEAALRQEYPVEIDGAAINRVINPETMGAYGHPG